MRIHTKTVFQMTADPEKYELLQDDFYEYDGPVSECIGGGGSSSPPSNTTQSAVPWSGVQAHLRDLYNQASRQGDVMSSMGQRLGQADPLERMGQSQMLNTAMSPGMSPYAQQSLGGTLSGQYLPNQGLAWQQLSRTLEGGYKDAALRDQAQGSLQGFAGGDYTDPSLYGRTGNALGRMVVGGNATQQPGALSGIAGGRQGVSRQTISDLRDTAGGKYLHGGEGFDAAMEAAAAQIMPQVGSQFAGAGTYSGGLRKSAQAKELGRAFAGLYGQERDRQMGALDQIGALEQTERARQMQAMGLSTGIDQQNRQLQLEAMGLSSSREQGAMQRQMEALGLSSSMSQAERDRQMQASGAVTGMFGDERQRQMQGLGLAPSVEGMRYQPGMIMQDVGQAQRAEANRIQDVPWEAMSREAALYGGFMSPTTVTNATGGGMSPWGGALSGASMGSMFGPWGAAGGAVLGGLFA